jgi:hypothetical protein
MTINHAIPTGPEASNDDSLPLAPQLVRELRKALRTIRFGAIELVIHDGRVVQLEVREKVRIDAEGSERRR